MADWGARAHVAVDLDRLWRVLLTLLDLGEPDLGDRLELGLAVQVTFGLGGEAGGDLLLESVLGSVGRGRHTAVGAGQLAEAGARDVPSLGAVDCDRAERAERRAWSGLV